MKIQKQASVLTAGTPDAEQLEKINRQAKSPLKAEEVYVFSVRLCDDQPDRDHERFSTEALKAQAVAARSIPNYRTLEAFMDALDKRFHISERHDSGVLVANMIDGSINEAVRVLRGEFSGDDRTLNTVYQTVIQPLFSVLGLRI